MKLSWKTELAQWILILGMWIAAAITWSTAPDRIPVHWNLAGEVDRYGGKFEGILLLPVIAIGMYLLLAFIPRLDPGRANYATFARPYAIIRTTVTALMAVIYAFLLATTKGAKLDARLFVIGSVGLMFIVLGAVMGKVRPNWFVGVRTPWTLSSKTSWTKTHRLAGWMFIAAGALTIVAVALPPTWCFGLMMTSTFVAAVVPIIYSYVVWRTATDKISPGGTTPAENGQPPTA